MQFNNKFNIGDTGYTYAIVPIFKECPICEGNGSFMHNDYTIRCSNCKGSGKLHYNQNIAVPCKVKISSIRIKINSKFESSISYKTVPEKGYNVKYRSEKILFKTYEEAEEKCKMLNHSEK